MQTIEDIGILRSIIKRWRFEQKSIAFIPTMGNLHKGHLALVKAAKEKCDKLVVSIFVNPMQFGPEEDFQHYPKTLIADQSLLVEHKVDSLFIPHVQDIFPSKLSLHTQVHVPGLSEDLCGKFRPGHFQGVTTIVNKLFNIVTPDMAFFGEKDFQQLLIIKKMVADLNLPIEIVQISTQRNTEGLALSSRNKYLSDEEKLLAPKLYEHLKHLKIQIESQPAHQWASLIKKAYDHLEKLQFKVQYLELRSYQDLSIPLPEEKELVLLVAAYLGQTRLIDNIFIKLNDE